MAHKVNPIGIRLNLTRTWPSLWHSEYNYPVLLNLDFFFKKYLRDQFRLYGLDLAGFFIKRCANYSFISIFIFNTNPGVTTQFKRFLFLRHWHFFRVVLDLEIRRFLFAFYRASGLVNVRMRVRYIRYQRTNLKAIIWSSSPLLFANYFVKKYIKANSFKRIFKSFRSVYASALSAKLNVVGVKVKLSGPVKAPRTRRSQVVKALFRGAAPVQTFDKNVDYVVKTRSLREGTITLKVWFTKLLENKKYFSLLNLSNAFTNLMFKICQHHQRFRFLGPRIKTLELRLKNVSWFYHKYKKFITQKGRYFIYNRLSKIPFGPRFVSFIPNIRRIIFSTRMRMMRPDFIRPKILFNSFSKNAPQILSDRAVLRPQHVGIKQFKKPFVLSKTKGFKSIN